MISYIERTYFNDLLNRGGYVLDFSTYRFNEFTLHSVGIALCETYNLYKYRGLGPGPFNSPSEEAILAAIDPAQTDYEYFVADIQTKEVYFAKTYDEHLVLKSKYVDKE